MDQPARRVAYGSLNSECRCLKLVDTFRRPAASAFEVDAVATHTVGLVCPAPVCRLVRTVGAFPDAPTLRCCGPQRVPFTEEAMTGSHDQDDSDECDR